MTPPQLMLWSDNNQFIQPLPLQVAQQYGFPLQYHTQDDGAIVYAVQDWVAGVGQAVEPRDFWAKLKKRLKNSKSQMWTPYPQLPYRARDGKSYKMDFADDVSLYKIAQQMDTNTGIRNAVLDFLAKAGAFVDELRQDPESAQQQIASHRQAQALKAGKSSAWVNAREMGVMTRNELTTLLVKVCPGMNIGDATNTVYRGTLGQDAKSLRQTLGIGPKQNPRDHMGELALIYTMAAEAAVRAYLGSYAGDDILPSDVVRNVISTFALQTGKQASEMAALIGVDLVTGRQLIAASTGGR